MIHTKGKRGNLLAIYYTELVLAEVHCRLYCYNLHLKHVEANWRLFSLIMDHIQILTILIFQKNYLTRRVLTNLKYQEPDWKLGNLMLCHPFRIKTKMTMIELK